MGVPADAFGSGGHLTFSIPEVLNQWSIRPALARIMSKGRASIIDWLIELGSEFPPEAIVESGVGGCPRAAAAGA